MIVLRPDPDSNLAEQVRDACGWRPCLLALVRGHVLAGADADTAPEPLRVLDRVLSGIWTVVVTDRWLAQPGSDADAWEVWEEECHHFAGEFGLAFEDYVRCTRQTLADRTLHVLFLERGRVIGAAPVPVAPAEDRTFDVNGAALALASAAHGAGLRAFDDVVERTRVALATPGQPPVMRPEPWRAPAGAAGASGGAGAPAAQARHTVEGGRCTACGKTGDALKEPCGRPELGRMGMIELD